MLTYHVCVFYMLHWCFETEEWIVFRRWVTSWRYVLVSPGTVCPAVERGSVLFWYRRTLQCRPVKTLLPVNEQQACAVLVISRQSHCSFFLSPITSSDTPFGIPSYDHTDVLSFSLVATFYCAFTYKAVHLQYYFVWSVCLLHTDWLNILLSLVHLPGSAIILVFSELNVLKFWQVTILNLSQTNGFVTGS